MLSTNKGTLAVVWTSEGETTGYQNKMSYFISLLFTRLIMKLLTVETMWFYILLFGKAKCQLKRNYLRKKVV